MFKVTTGPDGFLHITYDYGHATYGPRMGITFKEAVVELQRAYEAGCADGRPVQEGVPTLTPDGRDFPWGTVVAHHVVGQYTIVEYLRAPYVPGQTVSNDTPKTERAFHPYFLDKDTNHSYPTLDQALVGVIAMKYDGLSTSADLYFCRAVGLARHTSNEVSKYGSITWDWDGNRDRRDDPPGGRES